VGSGIFVRVRLILFYTNTAAGGDIQWRTAWYDTQGHFWAMLAFFILILLPFTIVSGLIVIYLPHVFKNLNADGLPHDLWILVCAIIHVIAAVANAACSTWLYRRFARGLQLPMSRQKLPPAPRGPANLHQRIKQATLDNSSGSSP
jgi:hypothetical protein